MCKAADKTVGALMTAIEPTLKSFLADLGIATTPEGVAAINAYDAALAAVEAWVPGSTSADVIQVINAFTQVFNTLPVPQEFKVFADLITAGIVTVIGVITGNSPAPTAPADATASAEELSASHALDTAKATEETVQALVPGFKRSLFHSPASQYTSQWNKDADAAGKPELKVA